MKIKREYDGATIEIELTYEEVFNAYRTMEKQFYLEDFTSKYNVCGMDNREEMIEDFEDALICNHDYMDNYWKVMNSVAKKFNLKGIDEQ